MKGAGESNGVHLGGWSGGTGALGDVGVGGDDTGPTGVIPGVDPPASSRDGPPHTEGQRKGSTYDGGPLEMCGEEQGTSGRQEGWE